MKQERLAAKAVPSFSPFNVGVRAEAPQTLFLCPQPCSADPPYLSQMIIVGLCCDSPTRVIVFAHTHVIACAPSLVLCWARGYAEHPFIQLVSRWPCRCQGTKEAR